METHQEIDRRSFALAQAVATKLDEDPSLLEIARSVCSRWYSMNPQPAVREWLGILQQPWAKVRIALLDESEEGKRLRQNSPFCGILTPRERWAIYQGFSTNEKSGA